MTRCFASRSCVVACGGDPKPEAPPAADRDAGKVIELTGKVTATRAAASRSLVVGNGVFADDVIETAPDASVVIELAHNHARWSLEAGIKSRVDASVAWNLPKQDAAKPVAHATSSAGRHAEREAANTQVTVEREKEDPAAGMQQNAKDREAAMARLQALQKQQAEQSQRIAEAKAAAAKSERRKGVKISKECMENPLSRGCDGPEPSLEARISRERWAQWAEEMCACADAKCAAAVDAKLVVWRAALDRSHPPSSTMGKEIARESSAHVKRYDECKAKRK